MKQKQATIKDIARRLGISHSTVSRALSRNPEVLSLVKEATRKRVEQAAAEMDYSPNLMAQGFVTGRTGTLGLLTFQINREMVGSQANCILRAADRRDFQILMSLAAQRFSGESLDDQVRQIRQMVSRGIDGLLIHTRGDQAESERIANAVKDRVPVVTFHQPTGEDLSGVVLDETACFLEVTEHLIRLGHQRIGFVGSDWNRNRLGSAKARGYLQAMEAHGLTPGRIPPRSLVESGYRLGSFGGKFTALVCRSDYTALGVCRGLREAGLRVPQDVAVTGYGDLDVSAYVTPALTTLTIPYEEIADTVMDLMLERLRGDREVRQAPLRSRLVVRESCGS